MGETKELSAEIFDIQGLSVHDGPGCRTVIFLKGCPLSCKWCANPEGINPYPEPMFHTSRCIKDANCLAACDNKAISFTQDGNLDINRSACASCRQHPCVEACLTRALELSSRSMTISEVMKIISRDRQYWGSEGGITLSGGEPMWQFEFTKELLHKAHDLYIHTAIETCGHASANQYKQLIPYLDWIFFDLKHMHSEKHRQGTGQPNHRILENAALLATEFPGRLIFRTPIIKDFNDDDQNLQSIIDFMVKCKQKEINLLPYHSLGSGKYKLLGINNNHFNNRNTPTLQQLTRISEKFSKVGIHAYLGNQYAIDL